MTNTPTRSPDGSAQEPLLPPGRATAAPANSDPAVGGQQDTARGSVWPSPHQDAPSRLITLPLSHVKALLLMAACTHPGLLDRLNKAIVLETHMRVADVEAQ